MPTPEPAPPRRVTLLLCDADGALLGTLPPYDVDVPYWPETSSVVEGARRAYAVDVTVLRVLPAPPGSSVVGGPVTYLAETAAPPTARLRPWTGADPLAPEELRLPWARPGGPRADLDWAVAALGERGHRVVGRPEQVKSWNLSSIWRLPLSTGAAWLKAVPPFFEHEGAVLARLDSPAVPTLIAHEGRRVLLAESPGEDCFGATGDRLVAMVELLVGLQAGWVDRTADLLALRSADFRPAALTRAALDVCERTAGELDDATRRDLEALLDGLPARFAAVEACGLPDTLVHGDFHPGNLLGGAAPADLVLLDWGDCGVGHPLLDQAAFTGRLGPADLAAVRAAWDRLWRAAVPGSDPERAAQLLAPVAALRQAVVYRMFLDQIEPDERVYHASDPARWLLAAARAQARLAHGEVAT